MVISDWFVCETGKIPHKVGWKVRSVRETVRFTHGRRVRLTKGVNIIFIK